MLQIRQQILNGFKSCGYRNSLLRESYQYFDGEKNRSAEIVGFHQPIYNSSTACIAAIDKTKLNGKKIETELSPYQLLGCPVLLVYDNSSLQFWKNSGVQVVFLDRIESKKVDGFFSKYKKEFSPESIYRAKTISRVKKDYQLSFVDIGLMGIIEEKEGKYLSELTERTIKSLKVNCRGIKENKGFYKWLFQAAFWLIGAKILIDKQVERFKNLKISNVDDLIERVQRHYNASETLDISNTIQKKAFAKAASKIVEPVASFAHLTTESLAYVYENALVSKETRRLFGTHATPSWLVNYIVWDIIDWIEAIPQEDRIILEPACGHAPFLTAGAKLLSFLFVYKGSEKKRHEYLKRHLIGIEKDSFAEEIARLALTLADIPNSNGWKIKHPDIYEKDILKKAAQKATILFCNPPFENFTPEEKQIYGNAITTGNKAAEILAKTLPYMPTDSVFGIILPQGFLHRKNLADLRKYILDNFELRTICNLPDNVFAKAGHLSTVLLGRKIKSKKNITYLNVTKSGLEYFKNTYRAREEIVISKDELSKSKNCSFRTLQLKEIWDYTANLVLSDICDIGKGLEYKSKKRGLPKGAITFSDKPFKGGIEGFAYYDKNISITELPPIVYLNLSDEVIRRHQWGADCGKTQVLLNYSRVSSGPWRLKAWIDEKGHPVTSNFLVVRSKDLNKWSLNCIWALLNSPYANAFAYCHNMERSNVTGVMRTMPVPKINCANKDLIDNLVLKYFSTLKPITTGLIPSNIEQEAKSILLEIDAEILRLYDLPPRLEKILLDFFQDVPRKGVDFKFDRYYPADFDSYIPLHVFISEEFENSTVDNVMKWVEENRTPEVIEAFKKAAEDFGGE